ncbi:MAG: head-tail connector protein [Devosia sp.]
MHIRVIEPPVAIISWEEVQRHLLPSEDDQELLESYLAAATAWLDGPDGWLGRSLGLQTLELVDCGFGNDRLPLPPIVDIVSIKYIDTSGAEQTMPDTDYRLLSNGSIWAERWPTVKGPDAVRIRYRAGYDGEPAADDGTGDVPPAIKHAILMLVGQWYATREAINIGNIVSDLPFGVEALLSPYRIWR